MPQILKTRTMIYYPGVKNTIIIITTISET